MSSSLNRSALRRGLLSLTLLAAAGVSHAGIVFQDNFNGENGGAGQLNYAGFANWTVDNGSVDLIGNGFFDFLPGNGLYVDMDGSTGNAGRMLSSGPINVVAGSTYTLTYQLAGNRRNSANESVSVLVNFGSLLNQTISLTQSAPFTTFTHSFTATSSGPLSLSFEGAGGDNVGMLLDNVKLEVPEPGSLALVGLALAGAAALRRRRR